MVGDPWPFMQSRYWHFLISPSEGADSVGYITLCATCLDPDISGCPVLLIYQILLCACAAHAEALFPACARGSLHFF